MADTPQPEQHLFDLLAGFDTAMLVTRSQEGRMHARPMAVAQLAAGADAYFVTSIDSPKVREVEQIPDATLTFQSSSEFASVSGSISAVRDRALIDRLWKEAWKVWFPKGKDDPAITLLKFDAQEGEFWDNSGMQGVKYAFEAAKAYITGSTPKADPDQHGKVKL